jgi:hypothetical protein
VVLWQTSWHVTATVDGLVQRRLDVIRATIACASTAIRAIALWVRSVHSKKAGLEDSAPKSFLVAMPAPFGRRTAVSGSDRYGNVVLESPESLAPCMLPMGLPRNPRELPISSHTKRDTPYIGRYVTPRDHRRGTEGRLSSLTTL